MADRDISRLKIEKTARTAAKRRLWAVWLLAAIAAAALFWAYGRFISVPSVRAGTVTLNYPSQAITLLNASGYVVAQRKASVAAKTTGRLVWLGVEEGSQVKQGQVIARLESEDAAAVREEAAARLRVANKSLEEARAGLDEAENNYERNKELFSREMISKSAFDAAEADYRKALAAAQGAESSVKAARAALRGAEVSFEYSFIRAPFDAVVLTKNADVGDIITPLGASSTSKAAVVTIADMGSLLVEADVAESNIGKVSIGLPCEIQLDALADRRFTGQVHMIVPTADRSKASVLVKVKFVEYDKRILPEMSAKVAFLSRPLGPGERRPVTGVDPSAIVTDDGRSSVFVIKNGIVIQTPVGTGKAMGGIVEVKGLKPGDRVALDPPEKLKTGSKVEITED